MTDFIYCVQYLQERTHKRTGVALASRWIEQACYSSLEEALQNLPEDYKVRITKEYYEVIREIDN